MKVFKRNRFLIYLAIALILLFLGLFVWAKLTMAATATWTNGGGDGLWSTCTNWSGGTGTGGCPGTADIATFNSTSTANVAIDAAVSVAGISIASTYSGIITQNTGITVTIGSSGFSQAGGTFNGGNSNIDINDGAFSLSGGAFTSTSATLSVERNFTITSGTFTANSGTVTFDGTSSADDSTLACNSATFSSVTISKTGYGDVTVGSACTIPLGSSPTSTVGTLTNNGTINLSGATWTLTGNYTQNTDSSLTMTSTTTWDMNVGTLGGTLTLSGGTLTAASLTTLNLEGNLNNSGNLLPNNLAVTLDGTSSADDSTLTCGTVTFSSVTISKTGSGDVTIGSSCTIPLGSSPTSSASVITNNGAITLSGATWTLNGGYTQNNGASLTMTSTTTWDMNNDGVVGDSITLSGGTLTASSLTTLNLEGSLNNTGNLLPNNLAVTLNGTSSADDSTLTCGTVTFSSVTISKTGSGDVTIGSSCTIPLGSSPTSSASVITNNGAITLSGATWTLNGGYTQNNGASLTMTSTTTWDMNNDGVVGDSITLSGGTLTAASLTTLNVAGNLDNTGNLLPNNLALTLDGTGSQDDSTLTCGTVTFSSVTISKTSATGLTVLASNCTSTGALTRTDGVVSNPASSYTLTVQGDFSMSTTDAFGGANLTVALTGGNTQAISQNAANTFSSPLQINKSGNSASLSTSLTTTTENCTVVEGTFDLNGKSFTCGGTFTVEDGGNLQLIGSEGSVTTPTLNAGSTVTYKGNGDGQADEYSPFSWTYSNLTVNFTDSNDTLGPNTLVSGLQGYWAMDEASWTNDCSTLTVTDSSSNNNGGQSCPNGTGPTGGAAGKLNNAGYFDGSNDYVFVSNSASLNNWTEQTISFWVKGTANSMVQWARIIEKGSNNEWTILLNNTANNNKVSVAVGNSTVIMTSTNAVLDDTWHHVLITINSTAYVSMYIDGTLDPSAQGTVPASKARDLNFGRYGSGGYLYKGYIDETRIYNRILTSSEISSLASAATTNNGLASLTINGNLTISSGIFTAPATLTIGGNFTNNATFNHNSGTVVFNDATKTSVLTGSGSPAITFNNLTVTTANKALQFTEGKTFRINGVLTLTGTSGNNVTINSTTSSQWYINHQGTEAVTYTTVTNSGCDGSSTTITMTLNSTNTDGGNNGSCWDFTVFPSLRLNGLRMQGIQIK